MQEDIIDYYQSNMYMKEHGWSIDELEKITPFERLLYEQILINRIRAKAENNE